MDLSWVKTFPTDPLALVSNLTLPAEPVDSPSNPTNLFEPMIAPPYCLIVKKSDGIPKQFIRALKPLSVPLVFNR